MKQALAVEEQLDNNAKEGVIETLEGILADLKIEHKAAMTFISTNYESWYRKSCTDKNEEITQEDLDYLESRIKEAQTNLGMDMHKKTLRMRTKITRHKNTMAPMLPAPQPANDAICLSTRFNPTPPHTERHSTI